MLNCYDKILKKHIESFLKVGKKSIFVYGLQNEEAQEELGFSQAGEKSDKIVFPLVMLVRLPGVEITDDAMTKRPATYEGYVDLTSGQKYVSLNCMRCTLSYVVDVFAENRKVAEDIGTQLYFRLRTHPNIDVDISLPIKDENGKQLLVSCTPDIVLDPALQHLRSQTNELSQYYKFRIKFDLKNVNIFDYEEDKLKEIKYEILAKHPDDVSYSKI